MTTWKRKLLLIPFGVAIGLALGLLFVWLWRMAHPVPEWVGREDHAELRMMLDFNESATGLYLYDEQIGFRFKPSYSGVRHGTKSEEHRTNSLGLLGEKEVPDDPAVNRWLFLGDSVTYGDGVAFGGTFTARLQDLAGEPFYIGNAACPGWNTRQELVHYGQHLSDEDWDHVVLMVCLNDLVEFRWARLADGRYDMVMEQANTLTAALRLARTRFEFSRNESLNALNEHDDATLLAWSSGQWQRYRSEVLDPFLVRGDCEGEAPAELDIVAGSARREPRPRMLVAMMPSLHQLRAIRNGASSERVWYPQSQMRMVCEIHSIRFLDLADAFDDAELAECFRDYLHLTERGHERVARSLWAELDDHEEAR